MKAIAIITARGGSKRIPRKNIKEFCGKPIIAYSIEAAKESGCFDEIMVSTDDEEIAAIARQYGANVPFMRSEATSNDYAVTADVVNEVVDEYRKLGKTFDIICCIYPTAPFIRPERLAEGIRMIQSGECDAITPVVKFSYPPQRGFIEENGFLRYKYPEYQKSRSQDLEPMYHDVGQYYFATGESFERNKGFTCDRLGYVLISDDEVQDIDNPEDWTTAELKYRMLKEIKSGAK